MILLRAILRKNPLQAKQTWIWAPYWQWLVARSAQTPQTSVNLGVFLFFKMIWPARKFNESLGLCDTLEGLFSTEWTTHRSEAQRPNELWVGWVRYAIRVALKSLVWTSNNQWTHHFAAEILYPTPPSWCPKDICGFISVTTHLLTILTVRSEMVSRYLWFSKNPQPECKKLLCHFFFVRVKNKYFFRLTLRVWKKVTNLNKLINELELA